MSTPVSLLSTSTLRGSFILPTFADLVFQSRQHHHEEMVSTEGSQSVNVTYLLATARARRRLPPPQMRSALRKAAGLSLRRVARELGVSATTVSCWESGKHTPSSAHIEQYLELLDQLRRVADLHGADR